MTDKEFAKERVRIKKLVNKWKSVFELDQWDMLYQFSRDYCQDNSMTRAQTSGRWHYRHATITFFLPETIDEDVYELERTIIHEFMHILLLPISQNLEEGHESEHEYTAVSLQRVAARAYLMGIRERKKKA